jgi:hypothetical protein
MFDQMAAVLPAYEDFLKQLTTGARVMNEALSTRALSIMSFVYSDLIHFCFDARKIFTKRKPGKSAWRRPSLDSYHPFRIADSILTTASPGNQEAELAACRHSYVAAIR